MHTTPPLTQTVQTTPSQFGQAVGDDSEEVENEQSVVQSSTGSKRFKAQSQSHGPPVQREASSQQDAGEENKKPAVIENFAVLKHMNEQTGVIKDMRREALEKD